MREKHPLQKKIQDFSTYAKLTHDSNFTYFYPSIIHVIILTARCISQGSCVDKCDPLCYVVDGYIHNRRWAFRLGILMIYKMFGITQWIKLLRDIRVNRKSSWSCICLKINGLCLRQKHETSKHFINWWLK